MNLEPVTEYMIDWLIEPRWTYYNVSAYYDYSTPTANELIIFFRLLRRSSSTVHTIKYTTHNRQ